MDVGSIQTVTAEISELKLWLITVVCIFLLIAIQLFVVVWWIIKATRTNLANVEARAFRVEASMLLDNGEYEKLKELAAQRQSSSPGDAQALYYLGVASFRCNEYIEAKRHFSRLINLDPGWKKTADSYLMQIEEILRQLKPKPI